MRDTAEMHAFVAGRLEGLRDEVYRALRREIGLGKLRPGDRVTELKVAAALRVSRTPVREGLAALEREGLVVRQGRGFVVPTLDDDEIDEVFELRCLVEPHAVRRLAETAGGRDLSELEAALREQKAAHAAGDAERFISANIRFRDALLALIRNRRLRRAIALYNDYLSFFRVSFHETHWRALVLKNLELLVRAIRAQDGPAAANVWTKHLRDGADAIARQWLGAGKDWRSLYAPPKSTTGARTGRNRSGGESRLARRTESPGRFEGGER